MTLAGFAIILFCVLYSNGFSAALDMMKTFALSAWEFIKFLGTMAVTFPSELGITDWLWTRGIYAIIAIVAFSAGGIILSKQSEKKLLGIISEVVGLVSTILTFSKSR